MTLADARLETEDVRYSRRQSDWRDAVLAFALLVLAVLAAFAPAFTAMVEAWLTSSAYHHGLLAAPIAVWVISSEGPETAPRPSPRMTIWALPFVTVWLIGWASGSTLLEQIAMVGVLIAATAALFGALNASRWSAGLALLIFAVPFGQAITPMLQEITAAATIALLSIAGTPAVRDATLIVTPQGRFEIAEACAGLNFLLAALMTAMLFGAVAFRTWKKRAAFLVFASGVALAANILRAALVILLSGSFENAAADHVMIGWAFYAALLFALIGVGARFRDAKPRPVPYMPDVRPTAHAFRSALGLTAAFLGAAIGAGFLYGERVIEAAPREHAQAELRLPEAEGWTSVALDVEEPPFGQDVRAVYSSDGRTISFIAAFLPTQSREQEIGALLPVHPRSGWRREKAQAVSVTAFGEPLNLRLSVLPGNSEASYAGASFFWFDGGLYASRREVIAAQTIKRLAGRNAGGGAIWISAAATGDTTADEALRAFLSDLEPFDQWAPRATPAQP